MRKWGYVFIPIGLILCITVFAAISGNNNVSGSTPEQETNEGSCHIQQLYEGIGQLSDEMNRITDGSHSSARLDISSGELSELYIYAPDGSASPEIMDNVIDAAEVWTENNELMCEISMYSWFELNDPEGWGNSSVYMYNCDPYDEKNVTVSSGIYFMTLNYFPGHWCEAEGEKEIGGITHLHLYCDDRRAQLTKADDLMFLTCLPDLEYLAIDDLTDRSEEERTKLAGEIKALLPKDCVVEFVN